MNRGFEKISKQQFFKDIIENEYLYKEYQLPIRKTKNSAGYDILALNDFIIKPNETKKIPTGIKCFMKEDEVLFIIVRSSMGFKYNIRLTNQVGVIDSDYYDNKDNEGHIFISLKNEGGIEYTVKKGEGIAQAIFSKYLTVDNEDEVATIRNGGIGSTNEGDNI